MSEYTIPLESPPDHFDKIASVYDHYRTLDSEPIRFLAETMRGTEQAICDLGCGTGRYLIPICRELQDAGVTVTSARGVDTSPEMIRVAARESIGSVPPIDWVLGSSCDTKAPDDSFSLVTAFNAFHHFPVKETLAECERILQPEGRLAIYIRTLEQEREHVWGQWFPDYLDYTKISPANEMCTLFQMQSRFRLCEEKTFRIDRKTTLSWIFEQTRNKHYSTLQEYSNQDFERAYETFVENMKSHYVDREHVSYPSSYSLFIYEMGSSHANGA